MRHPCEVSCAVQLTWPSHGKAKIRRPRTLSDTSGRGGPSSPCDLQGLRANLTLRSTAFRHAARLSITIAIAATIYRVLDLPRGYWVPLTVFFVLRPDFGSTFTRGLQRYIVTALGAVLATLISAALNPGPYALAAVLGGAIFAFLYANYGLFTVSMTAWIIFVVAFAGSRNTPRRLTAFSTRRCATVTRAVYALWPSWERSKLPDATAALIDAERA